MGRSTSRSILGTRFGSQYAGFFTISMRWCATNVTALNGPVPDGCAANADHACCERLAGSVSEAGTALKSFCHSAGEAKYRFTRLYGKNASGMVVVSSTVRSSILRADTRVGMRESVRPA
jgi:hypothetical protein